MSRSELVIDSICKLCNKAFESGAVPGDWRAAVVVPIYKSKEERNEYKSYSGISFQNVTETNLYMISS